MQESVTPSCRLVLAIWRGLGIDSDTDTTTFSWGFIILNSQHTHPVSHTNHNTWKWTTVADLFSIFCIVKNKICRSEHQELLASTPSLPLSSSLFLFTQRSSVHQLTMTGTTIQFTSTITVRSDGCYDSCMATEKVTSAHISSAVHWLQAYWRC